MGKSKLQKEYAHGAGFNYNALNALRTMSKSGRRRTESLVLLDWKLACTIFNISESS